MPEPAELVTPPPTSVAHSHSGRGLSWWSSFARCPRRLLLDKQLGLQSEDNDVLTPTSTGAVFHQILELYYKGELSKAVWDIDNPNVQEALRLFGGYKERFTQDEFGEVIGCEMDAISGSLDATPTLSGPLGVQPFSARYDMVVKLDAKALGKLSGAPRYLPLMEEGIYILDTKTMAARQFDLETKMRLKLQFTAYMMLWDNTPELVAKHGTCKGFIANCVVKHKHLHDGSFFSIYIPPPDKHAQEALKGYLRYCFDLREKYGEDRANPGTCDSYGVCPHYTSGLCKRY